MADARALRSQEREGAQVLAPVAVKERDEQGEETVERRVFFKTAFVFELTQTEPLAGVEPVSLEPPRERLTSDSHADLIEPMEAFARSLGYAVSFEPIPGSAGGWCDPVNKRIVGDITPDGVWVETERSRAAGRPAQLVEAWMIQVAWDWLAAHGTLTNRHLLATDGLNVKRSSFVCALLACLLEVEVRGRRPIELALRT